MKKHYLLSLIILISSINLYSQTPAFFGVTTNGGSDNVGTIFRSDTNGLNYALVDSFETETKGSRPSPQELVEVGGKFYGVTQNGGDSILGTLFEFDPVTKIHSVKYNFGNSRGNYPNCYLLLASNGKLYGTTTRGGSLNLGTLFEYNITTGVLTFKVDFNSIGGFLPTGKMVEASTGEIYGITKSGGTNNNGLIYKYTISTNTLIKKDDFNSTVNGEAPEGGLIKANNGKLYGTCTGGGVNADGTIFEYNFTTDSLKKIHDFDEIKGKSPNRSLIQASNGKLYGTTRYGGSFSGSGRGTLYEYGIALDSFRLLKSFYSSTSGPGYYPEGIVETSAGSFLMNMATGGPNLYSGAITEYSLSTNSLVNKQYFDRNENGAGPQGSLVKHSATGKYYGVCLGGGKGDKGVIFEYDNALDTITYVKSISTAIDGKSPTSSLLKASNGKLYGITTAGGDGYGVIFEVDPNTHNVVVTAKFTKNIGRGPSGALVEHSGKIYGTTSGGGMFGSGTIYSYDISNQSLTRLVEMATKFISWPEGGLIKANNGKLYGTASSGGGNSRGALFEYDIALDTLIVRDYFKTTGGRSPNSKLLQASNGKLYGTTTSGGKNNLGIVFEFDFLADSIKTLASFNDTNGKNPRGGLIQTSTGKLFGMTNRGNSTGSTIWSTNNGVVYEFDLTTNTIIPRADFARYTSGYGGHKEFIETSNGMLYGLSNSSSIGNEGGIIVKFNPQTYSLTAASQLAGSTFGNLVEVSSTYSASIDEYNNSQELLIYPNPTDYQLNIDTKGEKINSIKVYDMTGKLILSRNNNTQTIDVLSIQNGTYIIQVSTDNGIAHSRFIKQ